MQKRLRKGKESPKGIMAQVKTSKAMIYYLILKCDDSVFTPGQAADPPGGLQRLVLHLSHGDKYHEHRLISC